MSNRNQEISYRVNRRVMFIEPPFYRLYHDQYSLVKYPLGLGYLSGAVIKNTNWSVQTYNADFNVKKKSFDPNGEYLSGKGFKRYLSSLKDHSLPIWKEVKTSIEEYNPSVIGFTVKSQNFTSATVIAKIAKEINPKIKILVGGAHSTMNGSKVFECDDIDFACIGEGENTIAELLNALEKNIDLNSVNGIMFRDNNKIISTKPRAYIDNLDTLDFALTHAPKVLKDFDKYPKQAFGYIFGSRGCPYACTFCESKAMWTRKVRYRSPENIVAELKLMREFGINQVNFDDDTFGVSKKNIKAINEFFNTSFFLQLGLFAIVLFLGVVLSFILPDFYKLDINNSYSISFLIIGLSISVAINIISNIFNSTGKSFAIFSISYFLLIL
mgnify:CR=1 FL=1